MDNTMLQEILDKLSSIEKRLSKIEKTINNNDTLSASSNTGIGGKKIKIKKSKTKKIVVKTGNITMTIHPNGCTVTGDTFDKKAIIKGCKGWWTPNIKGWTVKSSNVDNLKCQLEECTKNLNIEQDSSILEGIDDNYKPTDKSSGKKSKKEKSVSSGSFNGDALDFLDDSD